MSDAYAKLGKTIEQARQQEGLLVADTLYQQALKLGDKKAQCLAYIIPLQFYISQKDDSKIEKASTDLKEISRANNYLQYYYHAWRRFDQRV